MNLALEDLEVFKRAEAISDSVWSMIDKWEWFEKSTVGKQLSRAVDSIGANIAEGYGRYSFKENVQFCYYARGSLFEATFYLRRVRSRGLLDSAQSATLLNSLELLGKMLNRYISSIKHRQSTIALSSGMAPENLPGDQ